MFVAAGSWGSLDLLRDWLRRSAGYPVFELSRKDSRRNLLQLLPACLSCCPLGTVAGELNCGCLERAALPPGVNDASDEWNPGNRARMRAPGTTSEGLRTRRRVSLVPEPF